MLMVEGKFIMEFFAAVARNCVDEITKYHIKVDFSKDIGKL